MKAILPIFLVFLSTTLFAQNIPSIEQVEAELEELKKKDDLRTYALNVIKTYEDLLQAMQENIDNSQDDINKETLMFPYEYHRYGLVYKNRRTGDEVFINDEELENNWEIYVDTNTWTFLGRRSELVEGALTWIIPSSKSLSPSMDQSTKLGEVPHDVSLELDDIKDSLPQGTIIPITRNHAEFRSFYGDYENMYEGGSNLNLLEEQALIDSALKSDIGIEPNLTYRRLSEEETQVFAKLGFSYWGPPQDDAARYRLSYDDLTFYLIHIKQHVEPFERANNPILLYKINKNGHCQLLTALNSITFPLDSTAEILNISPNTGFFTEYNLGLTEDGSEIWFNINDIYILNNKPPFLLSILSENPIWAGPTPNMRLTSLFFLSENGLSPIGHFPLKAAYINELAYNYSEYFDNFSPCVDFNTSLSFSKSDYSYGLPNIIYTKTYNNYMSENWENYSCPCHDIGPHELIFTFDGKQYILQDDE